MTRRLPIIEHAASRRARDDTRHHRAHGVAGSTEDLRKTSLATRQARRLAYEADLEALGGVMPQRPRTRGECVVGPCPWAGCRYNLKHDLTRGGNLKDNFPDLDIVDMVETCALRVAQRGPAPLEVVARAMNLTRQGVQYLETPALAALASVTER